MNRLTYTPALTVFLLAFVLGLTSLNRGLQSDDYLHRQMLLNESTSFQEKISHFYQFLGPTDNIPWWTEEGLKISFWRPLSAASHWLDYQLWPNSSALMHMHSTLWYGLLAILVLAFFRRLLEAKLAFIATLLFCIDFSHFANISWIANRNSLIAACFILISFNNYHDWKHNKKPFNYLFALTAFALSLLSAEAGIILLALLFLGELFIFNKNKKFSLTLFLPLAPFMLAAGLWLIFYRLQETGTANNSMYFSPTENISQSILLILTKIPVFIFGNITTVEGFLNVFPQEIQLALSLFCALILLVIFYLAKDLFRNSSTQFFISSAIIALIPVSFVAVSDMRLVLFSSIFTAGLLAHIFYEFSSKQEIFYRFSFIALVFLHIVMSPLQWLHVGIRDFHNPPESFSHLRSLENSSTAQHIFVLNYPSPIDAYYYPFAKDEKNASRIFMLNNNFSNYSLSAKNDKELLLTAEQGFIFKNSDFLFLNLREKPLKDGVYARSSFNGMLSSDFRFYEGDVFNEVNFKVEILSTNSHGQITKMRFTFNEALENLQWVLWDSKEKNFSELSPNQLKEKSLLVKNF